MANRRVQLGDTLGGRYKITKALSQGGMGVVYEAIHLETDRPVALKVMLPELLPSEDLRERFRKEARAAGRIDSDFVVGVLDAGIDTERQMPFLVMELLRGETLEARIQREGALRPTQVLKHFWQAAMALDAAHGLQIVHRDLKPENLFIARRHDASERIKVLDFGLAKFVSTDTQTTGVVGTLLYMAPEQLSTTAGVSPATDLYALALIAFEALTGRPYWTLELSDGGIAHVAQRIAVGVLPETAGLRAERYGHTLPRAFDAWFSRATAQDPRSRFGDAASQVRSLAEALGLSLPSERDSRRPPPAPFDDAAETQIMPGDPGKLPKVGGTHTEPMRELPDLDPKPAVRTLPMVEPVGSGPRATPIALPPTRRAVRMGAAIGIAAFVPILLVLVWPRSPTEQEHARALRRVGSRVLAGHAVVRAPLRPADSSTEQPLSIDELPRVGARTPRPAPAGTVTADKIELEEEPELPKPKQGPLYDNPYDGE